MIDENGQTVSFNLTRQPEYVAALQAGLDHRRTGCLPHEETKAIISASAEINGADNALNAGSNIEGAIFATAYLDRALAIHVIR